MVRPEGDGLAELWESVTGEHVWASGDPDADAAAAEAAELDDDELARWVPAATSGRYASMAEFRRDWAYTAKFAGGQAALLNIAGAPANIAAPAGVAQASPPTAGADVPAPAPAPAPGGFGVPGTGKGG